MMLINEIKDKEEKDILCIIKANTLKIYSVYNMYIICLLENMKYIYCYKLYNNNFNLNIFYLYFYYYLIKNTFIFAVFKFKIN